MYNWCYYCPMNPYTSGMYRNQNMMPSHVRIFHASPDAPPVDVYVNNNKVASNLAYKDFTEYLELPGGRYDVKVYPAGKKMNPVIDTEVMIPSNKILTVAAVGKLENISLLPIEDTRLPMKEGRAYIRFGHLSPDAPNVDIRLPGGTTLFEDVAYKEVTDYIWAYPGNQTLEVYVAGTNNRVLKVPNVILKPNRIYTVYAVGLVEEKPPLEVVIPLDGSSYIK